MQPTCTHRLSRNFHETRIHSPYVTASASSSGHLRQNVHGATQRSTACALADGIPASACILPHRFLANSCPSPCRPAEHLIAQHGRQGAVHLRIKDSKTAESNHSFMSLAVRLGKQEAARANSQASYTAAWEEMHSCEQRGVYLLLLPLAKGRSSAPGLENSVKMRYDLSSRKKRQPASPSPDKMVPLPLEHGG